MSDRPAAGLWWRCLLLCVAVVAASCSGLQAVSALQDKRISLLAEADSMLQQAVPTQARQLGAEVVAAGQQADVRLSIEHEDCSQVPLSLSGSSARAASYELRCHIRFTATAHGQAPAQDSISVRDTFLYDSGGTAAAEFPARDNELQWLRRSLADEAALGILQRVAILLLDEHE